MDNKGDKKDNEYESLDDIISLQITQTDLLEFNRFDHFLSSHLKDYSRSFIKTLFLNDQISADGVALQLKKMPPLNTKIEIHIPPPLPSEAIAQNLPLDILYEDEYLVIVNKEAGMVVHPAPGNYTGTLVNAILYHCNDLKGVGDTKRPGIVHRLDKGTSGVMVVAKERKTHELLVELFSVHDINRVYQALAMGNKLSLAGKIESTIGRHPQNRLKMAANTPQGKRALTHYKVLESFDHLCLVELKLETGRTHQIRVHLSQLKQSPILNDSLYGNPGEHKQRVGARLCEIIGQYPHPFLHAKTLGFVHPITKKYLEFSADLPPPFSEVLQYCKKQNHESP